MAKATKAKENIKDLKNINTFGFSKLTMWGMVGALTLFIYSLVVTIIVDATHSSVAGWIFGTIGLVLGVLYAILGVFALIKVIKEQQGHFWGVFLAAALFAILTPIAWIPEAGIGLSVVAGILFLVYYLLEKK